MLDPYKVRLMTKAETIRRENRGIFFIRSMTRPGYIARGMLRSFLGVTVAFASVLGLYMTQVQPAAEETGAAVSRGTTAIVVIYIAAALIYLILSVFYYRRRYIGQAEQLNEYNDCLRRLKRLQ